MIKISLIGLIILLCFKPTYSQYSYKLTFHSDLDEIAWDFIEDSENRIVAVGRQTYPGIIGTNNGIIWIINSPTDTSTVLINLSDTALMLNFIEQRANGNYFIIGNVKYPQLYNTGDLIAYELNSQFELISRKIIHTFDDASYELRFVKNYNSNYYIFGSGNFNNDFVPFIIKLNQQLQVSDSILFWEYTGGLVKGFMDCLLSTDSSQLYTFTNGMTSIYDSPDELMILDTSLNVISKKKFPYHISGNIHDVDYGSNMSAEWINDNSFIAGCNHRVIDFSIPPSAEHDIGLSILDSTLTLSPIVYAGAIDTVDYAADLRSIDALFPNEIFYAGTKRRISEFYPQKPSWIIAGLINQDLEKIYEHYFGGDAYYITLAIKAATDGGSVISALRHDYLTQNYEYDVHFLKLNSQGLITSSNSSSTAGNKFSIYPNPAKDRLFIESKIDYASMNVFDICGKKLISANLHFGTNEISIRELKGQLLIVKVIADNKAYSFKIIKVKQ